MYNQSEYEIYHLEKSARRIYKVCASKKTNTPEALIVVSIIQGELSYRACKVGCLSIVGSTRRYPLRGYYLVPPGGGGDMGAENSRG